jgi:hypothetical protein
MLRDDENELIGYGRRKVPMTSQSKVFMTIILFAKWADEIFFPTIESRRAETSDQGPASSLLDGRSSHHPTEFLAECERRNIYVLFFVPYSSEQCQPLRLITFGLLTLHFRQITFGIFPSAQSNKVIKMMGTWYQATVPHQVVSAWASMGLNPFLSFLTCLQFYSDIPEIFL